MKVFGATSSASTLYQQFYSQQNISSGTAKLWSFDQLHKSILKGTSGNALIIVLQI